MKLRDFISALEEMPDKDALVFFGPEGGEPIQVKGGVFLHRSGDPVVILAPISLNAQADGF